ncbi:MAG: hypothetical protein A2901_02745 [Elusimicrobia bacterium RIFCSPLOWO2_01_FULL_54_10]|nr:MAG: hypothetical protein A2901_02745 [Elusimicrobia bacterium RIFCSPLOWO2_01_FULL_54_10]
MLMALAHAKDGDLTPDEIAEALRFAAIHDALEIITGDSSPFNQEKWAHKAAIEDAALVKLSEELLKHDPTSASDWENLIVSYRKQDTRAARFVKHLDKQAHLVEFLDYSVRFPEHAADFLEINRKGELSQWDYSNSDVSNGGSEFPVIVELNRQLNAARSNEISKLPNPSFTPPAVIQTLLGMVLAILASPLGLGLLTLTAALIWPDYIREVLGSGGMAMAAAGTLEPATGSFITRILQALRPSKVRESILDLGRAGVQFEHPIYSSSVPIAQLRSIRVIAPHHALGEAAVSLPLLLHSLLRTAPGLERIWVETNFPELIEGMDPRVVISPDESRWADPLRPEAVIDLQAMFNKIHRIDDKKLIHDKLTEKLSLLGFNVPEFNETIINRSVPISGLIFVNPFGITNNGGAYLEKSWKTLILRLILNGKSVVLNGGRSENILDQLKSERLSQEILSDLGDSQAAKMFRVFKGDRKQFFDEIKQAESVITIDSSPFHLARLFGVPVVVITTKNSTGWVPEKEDNFRRVEDQQFALDEGIAAEALTKLNDKSHAAPSRLHIAHPPQDFLDAVGHEGPHRFQLMVMDMETPGVPSSPEPGINAIVFTGLRFDPQNFARVSDTLNDLTAYLSMQVDSGMNGSTSRAIVEAIKNAVIWGNKNRSRTHLAVRWRRDENKFIVDVIDQGARPIDFVGRHKPPDGIPDDISPMRIGYSGSIRRFLDQDHFETPLNRFESHQVYDFPLLTRDGRRVGQIVRLIFPARQAAGSKIPSISIPIAAFVIGSVLLNPLAAEAALASASILASPGMTALPELHGLGLGIWVLGAGVLGMAAQKPPKEHPLSPRQIKSALVAIAMEPRLRNIVQELMDGKSIEVVAANNGMTRRELYVNILQYDIFLSEKFTDHFGQTVFVELGPKRVVFENEPPPAKNEDPAPIERKKQAVAAKKDSQGEMVKTIHKLSKESEFYAKSLALFLREPAEFSQAIMKMIESTNPMEIQFLGFEAFRALVKTMPNVGVKLNEIEKLHFAKIVDLIAQKADEANELTMDQALSALAALVNSGWKTRNALKEELWVRIIDSLAGGVVSRPPLQAIAYVKSLGRWKNDPKVLDALKSLEGQDLSQSVHTAIAQALQTSVMDWHKIATAFLVAILGVATTSEAGAWLSAAQSVGWLRMEWLGALVLGMAALGMVWNKLEARVQSRWYAAVLAGVLTMSAFILFDLYDKGSFTFIGRSDDIVHRHLADGLITVGVYFQSRLSDIAHAFIAPVAELILSVLWFGKVHSTTAAKKRPSIWNGFWWGMSATFFIMSLARFWLDVGIMMLGHPGQYYLSAWVSLLINEWRGDILIIQPTLGKTVLTTLLTALVTLVGGWPLWRAYRREARRKALLPANPGRRWNKKAQADSAPVLSSSGEIHESDKAAEKTSMVPDADPASQNKPHLRLVQEQTERMAIASDYASKILYVQAALELGSFQAAMDFLNMIDEDIKTAKKMNKALKNPSQASETELLPVAEWVNDVAELKKKIPEATDIDIFIDAPSNDPDAKRLGDAFKTYAEARELPLDVVFSNFRFPVEELLPPGADSWLAMDGPDSRSNEEFAQGMIFSRIYREGRLLHRAVLPAIPTGKPAVAPKDGSSGHSTGLFDLSLAFDYPAVALVVSVLGGSLAATGVPFIISVLSGLALGIGAIGMVQATEPKIQEHKFRAGGTLLTRAMTEVMRRLWVHKIIRIGPNGWTRRISNWGYEETLLEDINKNLRSDILSEIIAKSRAHPDRTVTVVDWGTGTGKSLKEIRAKLQAKGISNVRLVGFGDQYYEVWHSMPQGITLIWDTSESFFKYFAPGEIDFLFSHYGFAHMREALAGYLLKLSSKMAPGGRIITNIYSNQSIHGLAHSINKEYSLNYLGIPKEYKNPSIQLDKKQGEGNDKIIPLVTEHALYLSQIGQIGFDSVSHRAQEVKKVEAARLAGADAADTAVIAVDPAHASKVELKKVESQFKRMKDSGKAVRVALVGSGLFSNSFTVSSLRLATGIQPMIVERNSQTDILDLDVLYNDIQAADPRLGKFSLVFIADSTLSIKMSWINSMIQQPVISGMEHEIQAALAAVLSQ